MVWAYKHKAHNGERISFAAQPTQTILIRSLFNESNQHTASVGKLGKMQISDSSNINIFKRENCTTEHIRIGFANFSCDRTQQK